MFLILLPIDFSAVIVCSSEYMINDAHMLRVFDSFNALDSALQKAKVIVQTQEMSHPDLMLRIEKYEEILSKQREVAQSLKQHMKSKNWVAVHKEMKIMSGLSMMMREDALDLVYEIQGAKIVHISNQIM